MISLIDYGLGNILAFANVYKRLNIQVSVAKLPSDLAGSDKLILPGVGSFDHAMTLFNESGLRPAVEKLVLEKGVPVLGICVGMQMLAKSSEEGKLPGLGWIDGIVRKFGVSDFKFRTHLPHMGWNDVHPTAEGGLFKTMEKDARFYFLHSYYFHCHDQGDILAQTDYGIRFCCAAGHKNVYGVQFHPEKSHHCGVQLLKNYAEL